MIQNGSTSQRGFTRRQYCSRPCNVLNWEVQDYYEPLLLFLRMRNARESAVLILDPNYGAGIGRVLVLIPRLGFWWLRLCTKLLPRFWKCIFYALVDDSDLKTFLRERESNIITDVWIGSFALFFFGHRFYFPKTKLCYLKPFDRSSEQIKNILMRTRFYGEEMFFFLY